MSEREKVYQLLDTVPDYNIGYVVAYLQGLTENDTDEPNEETIETMKEVDEMKKTGNCHKFTDLNELWASLEE